MPSSVCPSLVYKVKQVDTYLLISSECTLYLLSILYLPALARESIATLFLYLRKHRDKLTARKVSAAGIWEDGLEWPTRRPVGRASRWQCSAAAHTASPTQCGSEAWSQTRGRASGCLRSCVWSAPRVHGSKIYNEKRTQNKPDESSTPIYFSLTAHPWLMLDAETKQNPNLSLHHHLFYTCTCLMFVCVLWLVLLKSCYSSSTSNNSAHATAAPMRCCFPVSQGRWSPEEFVTRSWVYLAEWTRMTTVRWPQLLWSSMRGCVLLLIL